MKAIVLEGVNQSVALKEVPTPTPQKGEVQINIKAAALNHRDVWIQKGKYAGLKYPAILGSDGAGVVTQMGEDVDKQLLGKEVIINPGHNWGANPEAQRKEFKILGMPDQGTFAEYICVPSQYVFTKPAHLSFEQAAALPLGGLTAYRTLFTRGALQTGQKVLITGIGGGVALIVLKFCLAVGAKVWVTSGSDSKIEKAISLGAQAGVNYKAEKWHESLQQQAGGFDLIVDSAAGENFPKLIDLAATGGKIAMYGGTQGTIKDIIPGRIFWKQLSILGTTMGNEGEFASMTQLVSTKHIVPVIDKTFPMAEAEQALRRMDNSEQFGKIILQIY
ncbi:zinc-binding dehydrogenase [Rhodocytophaga rosea]|uniref:Zinc-binding dehydrogenase n=1 Tax=Rhodocytophaga rosea TaxID=2704465 RepID=A0A6C0GSP5_9BACT|nr:zinc-binding dehydrogenase [Rhodocytophaga rosea]QHT71026.1 zinc-binding dehydrogenase [Rhodocytophaga rosea]